jgi:vacuolar-type H+-ATPase catalytic subunit A/Vma1
LCTIFKPFDLVRLHILLLASHHLQPLSVQLGPGILGNIFDGIQRPLKAIAQRSGDVFIPRGVAVPALDETASWEFAPTSFKVRCNIVFVRCT